MESKNEFKKTDIKNFTCYYFNNIMRMGRWNRWIYWDLWWKKYLVLFGSALYDDIYNSIRYIISKKVALKTIYYIIHNVIMLIKSFLVFPK